MKIRWLFFVFFLVGASVESCDEAESIREARFRQNGAMAAGDAELAASFWTEDVTLRTGLGYGTMGKEAYKALIEVNRNEKSLTYCRMPDFIEVSPKWPLAYESGTWEARRGATDGPKVFAGRYSAQWVKRDGVWLIRSEIFVAITCHEEGCTALALP